MPTFGWLLIFGSVLLIRQVVAGRASETPQDLQDLFVAALRGDYDAVKEAATRKGESPETVATQPNLVVSTGSGELLTEMRRLGAAAKGYRIGATGPDYYDCSGLVWRAMRNLGYDLGRFTSTSFPTAVGGKLATRVSDPRTNDIVTWPRGSKPFGHIGVVSGPDTFYSALSTRSGIREAKISTLNHGTPTYWRLSSVPKTVGRTGQRSNIPLGS